MSSQWSHQLLVQERQEQQGLTALMLTVTSIQPSQREIW